MPHVPQTTSPSWMDPGELPAWTVSDLPAPPAFGFRGLLAIIGPGAILLATSIGGGEWLVGPATAARFGTSIMWIATVAIVLQLIFNLEAIRYTLYTGEPIYTGFMRLKPGRGFWCVFYALLTILQLGWPALALSTAGTVFSLAMGRLPGAQVDDASVMQWVGGLVIMAVAALLLFGGTIERMLERLSWAMLAFIFTFLLVVNLLFVPMSHTLDTLRGFIVIRMPAGEIDWALLGALVGTAACGGMGNLTITNWIRDKGFGMGATVGAIESAVGGRQTRLSPIGQVFPVTDENLRRWREWWRFVYADQIWIWAVFCFLGLFLNVNLATAVIAPGTNLQGLAAGAYQAQYLAEHMWRGLWYIALLNGFWILFSTNLGNTDIFVRTITDLSWTGSDMARRWSGERPAWIYYSVLAVFTCWGFVAVRVAGPFLLFQIMANIAGFILAVAGAQILIVNRRFLPPALRPPIWREALLAFTTLFYGFFSVRVLVQLWW
jgi:hypothetical protein